MTPKDQPQPKNDEADYEAYREGLLRSERPDDVVSALSTQVRDLVERNIAILAQNHNFSHYECADLIIEGFQKSVINKPVFRQEVVSAIESSRDRVEDHTTNNASSENPSEPEETYHDFHMRSEDRDDVVAGVMDYAFDAVQSAIVELAHNPNFTPQEILAIIKEAMSGVIDPYEESIVYKVEDIRNAPTEE